MKIIHFLLLSVFLLACNSKDSKGPNLDSTILLKASGLTGSVTIFESISKTNYEIVSDGNYDLNLPTNQTIYNLEIFQTDQQACTINRQLDLVCDSITCTADFNPVCAKKPLAGAVCITTPCQTHRYLTYGNACNALADNAWVSLESECGGLEYTDAFQYKPVYIRSFALLDLYLDPFHINQSDVIDDTLIIEFTVIGGCGSHDFTMYADDVFQEDNPLQINNVIAYIANDSCNSLVTIEKEFDLLPIKEIYLRAYPDATGEQFVNLGNLGIYKFTIN